VEKIDIWLTAKLLITDHGDAAWMEAVRRIYNSPDLECADFWIQVWKAVNLLLPQKPKLP
jgi:hypothetical protein